MFVWLVGMVYSLIGWNGVLCCLIGQNISIWKHVHLIGWNVSAIFCRITTATTLYLRSITLMQITLETTTVTSLQPSSSSPPETCEFIVQNMYSNIPKIGPPSKVSSPQFFVTKGAFPSKVAHLICAASHAVRRTKEVVLCKRRH